MAGGIRLVVSDEAVQPRLGAGIDQPHPVEPVGQIATGAFDTRHITMHNQAVYPASHVLGIVPAFEFQRLGFSRFFAVR